MGLNMIEAGKKYTDSDGRTIGPMYDVGEGEFVGRPDGLSHLHRYKSNGKAISHVADLIIPPQLPWPWVVGDWYLRRNGDAVELQSLNSDLAIFCKFSCEQTGEVTVYKHHGRYFNDSGEHKLDIIAHLGPLPQGVYHVSDGDTQLLKDLKRWQERGGKIETRFTDGRDYWGDPHGFYNMQQQRLLFRAVGCTDDREFPQPDTKPDPMQRLVTFGAIDKLYELQQYSYGHPLRVNLRTVAAESQP